MKKNYMFRKLSDFLESISISVRKKWHAELIICLLFISATGAWAQSAQVINATGGTGLNDGLKIVVNTNGALSVYRNNRTQYYPGSQWPSGQGRGVSLNFRFSKGSTYNSSIATLTACSTTPVQKTGNTYTTSITGFVTSTISSELFYVTINVTYTHPDNFFYVDYFVRAPSNLSSAGQNQLVHLYLDHDTYILGKDGSRGYRSTNGTGELIGNYRTTADNGSCGGGQNNPIYPSTHGFKTKNGFRSYYTGRYSSRNQIRSDLKLTNTLNTSCVDDGIAVEFTVGPFATSGQVLAKQVLHGYGDNQGDFNNTPVDDPAVPSIPSSPVTVEFTSNSYTEPEGNTDHASNTVKLRVSGGVLHQEQACNFTISGGSATQGSDYTYVKGFTIPAGNYNTPQEFTLDNITIKGNTVCQSDRTFNIQIDNPGNCNDLIIKNGSNNQATVTIEDDEVRPTITTTLPNLEYHYGQTVPGIAFTANPSSASIAWTNSNTSIGLAASGNGNMPSFTANNQSNNPITATITVTPKVQCTGTAKTFTIKVYPKLKITYDHNGGNAPSTANPTTFLYDNSTTIVNEPTRTGYTFKGWTCTELNITTPTKPFVIPANTATDLTLRADWGVDSYQIQYNLDGGTVTGTPNPTVYDVNTPTFALKEPKKPGHTFTGWSGTALSGNNNMTVTIPTGSTGDRNYQAHWTENTYTITYNNNSGTPAASPNKANYTITEVPFDINSTAPANQPTRTGYDFAGWTGPNATTPTKTVHVTNAVFAASGDPQNLTYMANWSTINYPITYQLNNGIASNPDSYNIETPTFNLTAPSRQNYVFKGWTGTDVAGTSISVSIPTGSTGARTYTAHWEPKEYTIDYTLNGGNATNPIKYHVETADFTLNNPTRAHYIFKGWTGTGLASMTLTVSIPTGSTGNRTYTAHWEPKPYTIAYTLNGATVDPGNPTQYDIESSPITLINPQKTGYDFSGWSGTDITGMSTSVTLPTGTSGDRSYTANWSPTAYTITYDYNGPTTGLPSNPANYTIESANIQLANPTWVGRTFTGWSGTDITGTSMSVQIPQGSMGNRSYTATWTTDEYTITYNLDGGTAGTPANPDKYDVTSPNIQLSNPTKSGYTFAGWTGTDLLSATQNVTIPTGSTGNRNYVATWTPIVYNINFIDDDAHGNTPLPAGTTTLSGGYPTQFDDTELPKSFTVTATKPGYTFVGWADGAGAGGGSSITIPKVSTSHAHQTYKAIWTTNSYTITFKANGGTNPTIPANWQGYDMTDLPLNAVSVTPTRTGYTFDGWTGHGLTNHKTPFNITSTTSGVPGNLVYDAQWNIITYTIGYTLDGGTVAPANPTSYQVITPTITLNNPTKTGYTFAGWTGTDLTAPTQTVTISTGTIGNRNYTATWSENGYTITYNLNGGTAPATANPSVYKITDLPLTINTTIPANQPTRTGYTFDGWTGHDISIPNQTITVQNTSFSTPGTPENLTYTANWTPVTYTIDYDTDGGAAIPQGNYTIETPTFNLPTPSKPGWTFTGWTGSNGTTPQTTVTVSQGSTGNLNYTANWNAIGYTITFEPNGGVNPTIPSHWLSYDMTTIPTGIDITPTRLGYTFKGWKQTAPITGTTTSSGPFDITPAMGIPANLTFTAEWEEDEYMITYHVDPIIATPTPGNPDRYKITQLPKTIGSIEPSPFNPKNAFLGWTCRQFPNAPMSLTFTIPDNTTGDLDMDSHWKKTLNDLNNNHPGSIKDTLFVCEGPRRLNGDPQGKSWKWILPDSSSVTTTNVMATMSGKYVCVTDYGTKTVNDTLHVYFLMKNSASEINYITTTGAKLNRPQEFVLNIPQVMWPHITSNWDASGGGVVVRSSADSLIATWGSTGEKIISVNLTFNYGGIVCSKRLTTKLQLAERSLGFFVDYTAVNGKKDGSSWKDAHLTIQDALRIATVGDRIWVAQGTYRPVNGESFEITQDSIEIYGGFEGTEEYLYQRNIAKYPVITKGNGTSVWKVKNCSGARIDGFVIEDGRAPKGAGILFENGSGKVVNDIIRKNIATSTGGGVYVPAPWLGQPTTIIANTEISGNQAPQGAGIYNDGSNTHLLNITVSGNKGEEGAGLYNEAGNPNITNSIIWGNLSTKGNKLTNDVMNNGGNPVYAFNIIGGSEKPGGGWNKALGTNNKENKDRSPLFYRKGFEEDGVTMRSGDYRLTRSSIAIDAGSNYAASVGLMTPWDMLLQYPKPSYKNGLIFDLNHNNRIHNSRIDFGAYESGSQPIITINISRPVRLPKVKGLTTNPGPGQYYVKGHDDFVFTIAAEPGYSLDYLTVTTGIPLRDKDGILMKKNPDGSVTVTILQVWEPLDISINGVSPVSNGLIPNHKVWAYKQNLHIDALYPAMLQVYTLDGILHIQQSVTEGHTTIPLYSGFYTVVLDGKVYKVMIQ